MFINNNTDNIKPRKRDFILNCTEMRYRNETNLICVLYKRLLNNFYMLQQAKWCKLAVNRFKSLQRSKPAYKGYKL